MRKLLVVLIIAVAAYSCNNDSKKAVKNYDNITMEQINAAEDELFNGDMTVPNVELANELARLYVNYANQNPKDSLAPDLLFKAADISMNMNNPRNTINLFNHIRRNYPDYKNNATILFLTGFVYDDQLKDYESAKKYYTEFLEKYPDNDFADDARISLDNLGKSPEELIKEFEK